MEDFAQLAGLSRDTKYDFTIEKMVKIIETYCTFPVIEKYKFFRLLLFCFLTGNEDMHMKNFSLITRHNRVEFSPAYDLLNSTLALGKTATEETALMLAGKRREFRRRDLVDYLGKERLGLTNAAVEAVLTTLEHVRTPWKVLIGQSFLTDAMKQAYWDIAEKRFRRLSA